MGWLTGQVALITGGGSGIGRAVVERYIDEGARVGVLERSQERVEQLRADFGDALVAVQGDVTRLDDHQQAVGATVDAFGQLDIFVGNAGVFDNFISLEALPEEQIGAAFDELFAVNVKGYLLGAKAALPELRRTRGCMIFTASNASFWTGGGGPLYTASKHAVVGLVRQLAYELAPDIRVNGVAPGGTQTNLSGLAALGRNRQSQQDIPREQWEAMMRARTPLRIVAEPRDHAGAYVFLASRENARTITGMIIDSTGGLGIRGIVPGA
jgi:NAD(P)-dependent dehydrogenase (short-subunit alcohol dehydrogenase family)